MRHENRTVVIVECTVEDEDSLIEQGAPVCGVETQGAGCFGHTASVSVQKQVRAGCCPGQICCQQPGRSTWNTDLSFMRPTTAKSGFIHVISPSR